MENSASQRKWKYIAGLMLPHNVHLIIIPEGFISYGLFLSTVFHFFTCDNIYTDTISLMVKKKKVICGHYRTSRKSENFQENKHYVDSHRLKMPHC